MHSTRTFGSVHILTGEHNIAYAEELLVRAAKQSEPICEKRGWTVRRLVEFYPPQQHNLYGLNVNKGAEIRVRLRMPGDRASFLEYESVLKTLLHELCHIVHGAHSAEFYQLLDELVAECEALHARGVTQGMGHGTRLGGNRVVVSRSSDGVGGGEREAVRKAWLQRSRLLSVRGDVQRLGGDTSRVRSLTPAQAAAQAAERRLFDDKHCATTAVKLNNNDVEDDEEGEIEIISITQQPKKPVEQKSEPVKSKPSGSPAKRRRVASPEPSKPRQPTTTWRCHECTLINGNDRLRCDACDTPRRRPPALAAWMCPSCTFANVAGSIVCAVCSAKKPPS
jgi:hypothetical protein